MPVKLNQFQTGPVNQDSTLIGYQAAAPGGERRWSAGALRDWLLNEMSSRLVPVGTIAAFPATQPPAGWLKLNAQILNRSQFPALWAYAQGSGNLVAEAQWWAPTNTVNRWGSFSLGDGINTFRLPEFRGEFIRAWDDGRHAAGAADGGRVLGSWQTHDYKSFFLRSNDGAYTHGPQYMGKGENGAYNGTLFGGEWASRWCNGRTAPACANMLSISWDATEIRVRNVSALYCIKF